jgi:hypothetical protein
MTTVEDMWKSFERETIDPTAGEIQRECMQSSFYAGAVAVYRILFKHGVQLDTLRALQNELAAYAQSQAPVNYDA